MDKGTYAEMGSLYRRIHQLIIRDGIGWEMATGGVLQLLAASIIAQALTREQYLESAGKAYDIVRLMLEQPSEAPPGAGG